MGVAASAGLLLRGVGGGTHSISQTFDLGGVGIVESVQPFDIEAPPTEATSPQSFDILGSTLVESVQPFDIEGALSWTSVQPFAILGQSAGTTLIEPNHVQIGVRINGVWHPGLAIFTVAGEYVGSTTDFTITTARSRVIGDSGQMEVSVQRLSADDTLFEDDRLVVVGNDLDMELWVGTLQRQDAASGQVKINCPDVTDLLLGPTIDLDLELSDDTPARYVYSRVLEQMNLYYDKHGEPRWLSIRSNGATTLEGSRTYPGDALLQGDALSVLRDIATATQTEWHWTAEIIGTQIVPMLVVRDRFEVAGGVDLTDGPTGNLSDPQYTRDPSKRIDELVLVGARTAVAEFAPEWARWAVHEIEPEITISRPTPPNRRRRPAVRVNVDLTLSKEQQRGLAQQTVDRLTRMFHTFLYAWHQEYGRPFHPGWEYSGTPQELAPFLHTGRGWRTRAKYITLDGGAGGARPAAGVMWSDSEKQILVVDYNRVSANQTVRRFWWHETPHDTVTVSFAEIHGWARVFGAEGGVLVDRFGVNFDHAQFYVSNSTVNMAYIDERQDADGNPYYVTIWIAVRRVTSITEQSGTAREGQWIEWTTPHGPTVDGEAPYLRVTPRTIPELVDESTVSKLWYFELDRIWDWDPRRDGVGQWADRPGVVRNSRSRMFRWMRQPWFVGGEARTALLAGMTASQTAMAVESVSGFPESPGFYIEVGSDPAIEVMWVRNLSGNHWDVYRAQKGTVAKVHEPGFPVKMPETTAWDGFVFDYSVMQDDGSRKLWPQGEEYANRILDASANDFERLRGKLSSDGGGADWLTVRIGSMHDVIVTTEGWDPGVTRAVRVIGYTVDEEEGIMDLMTEVQP